jgi:putative phosphoribosyl transferase
MTEPMAERIYSDFESAGRTLAAALAKRGGSNSVVMAIANSGVPVAIPVADTLEAPLDVLVVRRLFVREGRRLPVAVVSIGGNIVVDSDSGSRSSIEELYKQQAIAELSARAGHLRSEAISTSITNLNVIIVDNGIHTGSTLLIAINALRKLGPRSVTVAVPVGDESIKETIESVADEVVCLKWSEQFGNTALWYKNFNRPSDDDLRLMLARRSVSKPQMNAEKRG